MKPVLLGLTLIIVGACRSGNGGGAQTPAPGPPTTATVHELLASNALVGRMVEVTGRCLGYSSPTVAQGSQSSFNPPRRSSRRGTSATSR